MKKLNDKKIKSKSSRVSDKTLMEWDITVNRIRKLTGRKPLVKESDKFEQGKIIKDSKYDK